MRKQSSKTAGLAMAVLAVLAVGCSSGSDSGVSADDRAKIRANWEEQGIWTDSQLDCIATEMGDRLTGEEAELLIANGEDPKANPIKGDAEKRLSSITQDVLRICSTGGDEFEPVGPAQP